SVVEQIHKEYPDQPVYDVRTMRQWVDRTLQRRTLLTGMVALFGGASLLLACICLYGNSAVSRIWDSDGIGRESERGLHFGGSPCGKTRALGLHSRFGNCLAR